jgi:two-component system chemotaxis sensor kinase CheA
MDDFEIELRQGFLEEAEQLLADVEQCFLSLETNPGDGPTLDKIFRLAHNLKGSAKAVGFEDVGVFAHKFESFLLKIKSGEIPGNSTVVSLCLSCNDFFVKSIASLKADMNTKIDGSDLVAQMAAIMEGGVAESVTPTTAATAALAQAEPAQAVSDDTSEVQFLDQASDQHLSLDGVATQASNDQLLNAMSTIVEQSIPEPTAAVETPLAAVVPIVVEAKAPPAVANAGSDESIRVSLSRLEKLVNFVGEMVILQTVLQAQTYEGDLTKLRKTVHQLGKVTKDVQDISMGLRMVPVKQTFQKMQRIVRDTAALLNKKINFTMSGEETELDKTVLENLGDPLVHMIRNAADHGIESAELRKERGKPEAGSVFLTAYHRSGRLVIEIKDDGGGIDGQKLVKKAIEKGILKPGTVMAEKEAVHLIFAAGFSTKTEVTEVSGRGVGMDVVRKNIDKLQGEIQIDTKVGVGSTFQIVLPLTLAIIDGMIVTVAEDRYVIPLTQVHESVRPAAVDVKKIVNVGEILLLRGENLPLYRLSTLIGKKTDLKAASDAIAIIVRTQATPFAVLVDDILGQQQVVIKKLGNECSGLRGFSGSAILGDGKPALILELPDLIQRKTGLNTNESRRATA